MIDTVLKLMPIRVVCNIQVTDTILRILGLEKMSGRYSRELNFFKIVVKPTKMLQAAQYHTLVAVIPQYLRTVTKLKQNKNWAPEYSPL